MAVESVIAMLAELLSSGGTESDYSGCSSDIIGCINPNLEVLQIKGFRCARSI
jgi:hypothetical protein